MLGLIGLFVPIAWTLLMIQWVTYFVALLAAGTLEAIQHRDVSRTTGMPLGIAAIHLSWGLGFWRGLLFRGDPR